MIGDSGLLFWATLYNLDPNSDTNSSFRYLLLLLAVFIYPSSVDCVRVSDTGPALC